MRQFHFHNLSLKGMYLLATRHLFSFLHEIGEGFVFLGWNYVVHYLSSLLTLEVSAVEHFYVRCKYFVCTVHDKSKGGMSTAIFK
jgi:hypothetical protein